MEGNNQATLNTIIYIIWLVPFLGLKARSPLIIGYSCKVVWFIFIGCLVETRNNSILSLAFIASLFRVTEENL